MMSIEENKDSSSTIDSISETKDIKNDLNKIYSISLALIQLISENLNKPSYKAKVKAQKKSPFNSRVLPRISLSDYVSRICKYTKISDSTLTLGLIYIDRLCKKNKILITEFNVHRIVFTSFLIAIKYNEDKYYSNAFYSKIGGIELKQLNILESQFLIGINFDLYLDKKLFQKYEKTLWHYSMK